MAPPEAQHTTVVVGLIPSPWSELAVVVVPELPDSDFVLLGLGVLLFLLSDVKLSRDSLEPPDDPLGDTSR